MPLVGKVIAGARPDSYLCIANLIRPSWLHHESMDVLQIFFHFRLSVLFDSCLCLMCGISSEKK